MVFSHTESRSGPSSLALERKREPRGSSWAGTLHLMTSSVLLSHLLRLDFTPRLGILRMGWRVGPKKKKKWREKLFASIHEWVKVRSRSFFLSSFPPLQISTTFHNGTKRTFTRSKTASYGWFVENSQYFFHLEGRSFWARRKLSLACLPSWLSFPTHLLRS